MAILIINGLAEPIVLPLGTIRVGRTDSNDVRIPDSSVSSRHCELVYSEDAFKIRDLGSTNGTFVNGTRIAETVVNDGDIIKFGNVEATYDAQQAPIAEPAPVTAMPDSCLNHPTTASIWICQKCNSQWCSACVQKQFIAMRTVFNCPSCGGFCTSMDAYRKAQTQKHETFTSLLFKSFVYPLKGMGLATILAGAVTYALLDLLKRYGFGFIGFAAVATGLFATGYLCAFMQSIVTTSASGDDGIPMWPDLSDVFADIIIPFFQFATIFVACFLPGIILAATGYEGWSVVAFVLGIFGAPMAILAVCVSESVMGLNPLVLIPSIFKVFGTYCVTFFMMGLIFGVYMVSNILAEFIPNKIIAIFLINLVALYFMIVEMRILGILYHTRKHKFNWFKN